MRNWDLLSLSATPDAPEVESPLRQTARVLSSSSDARAIALRLPAGDHLQDHEVHERAWLVVIEGEVEIESAEGKIERGGPGLLTEFEPRERHEVRALVDARLLLLLTPWPGRGHPGAMDLDEKTRARVPASARAVIRRERRVADPPAGKAGGQPAPNPDRRGGDRRPRARGTARGSGRAARGVAGELRVARLMVTRGPTQPRAGCRLWPPRERELDVAR